MEKIVITVDKIGRPKIEAQGFIGGKCMDATKPIVGAFEHGANVAVEEKGEMYLSDDQTESEMESI